ncbi:hypothetical protein CLM62_47305 [Streptomyces sp. SA15]|uniref:polymorphic toxin-type HINT domain-containing protein n=1 Tax=Streptomyces sp. SA15 TaxID=934019 RepID=UPI000BB08F72|nr:polymorphic toxin-type HINT domain-containing protein [Streptomyces sp. SA15]PAZ09310.1 hypothetical protein CLM62_47305 [Streptomyces sp. SA15]
MTATNRDLGPPPSADVAVNTYTKTVGLPQTVTHPAAGGLPSERVGFGYHGFDQITGMSVAGKNFVSTTEYTPLGDVLRTRIGTFAQQLITSHEFDEQTRRPTRTIHDQESTVADAVVTTRISDTRTSYDQVGNVLKITDAQGPKPTSATTDTQCFVYDYQRRMTDAWTATDDCAAKPAAGVSAGPKVGGPDSYWHSYTFDAVGNRQTEIRHDPGGVAAKGITREYAYAKGLPTGSRLESVFTKGPQGERKETFEYDGAGNTTKRTVDNTAAPGAGPEVDPAPQILRWDVEGHLEQVEKGSEKTSYVYDASGNRLIRRDPSGTTLYLPGTEVKLGKDGTVVKGTRYYTHPAGPTMVRTAEGGKITTSYLLPDRNGTATTSVEATSKSVTRRKFTPFGETRGAKPSAWPGERGYLGGTMDESTGLTHLGAREYDPSLGRFLSVDPQMDTAESQTMNPYAYGNNSPVTFSDPTGRAFCADEACRIRVPAGGGSSGGGGGDSPGGDDGSSSGVGAVPPAPAKPTPTVSQEDVQRARLLKQQSKMDAVKRIAMEVLKDASGYNDVVSCIGGDLGTCAMLALEAAVPWAGKAKRIVKALDRAWSAYNKWEDEVRWAVGVMRRADADAAAMAKYAEDMTAWKKKADAAKAAKKADETAAEAAKKADSGGGDGGGGSGADSCLTNSFTPDTKVLLADGSTKAIKDLKPGDKVQATDPETGTTEAKTIDATIKGKGAKHLVKVTVDTDGTKGTKTSTVTSTDGHPFWVPELSEWINATDLRTGQWLRTGAGTRIQITAVERRTQQATVHNLTVSDYHTYYVLAGATPVLVHNCNTADPHSLKPTHEIEGNASTKRVKAMRDDMRNGDFDWEQSPISVVTHEDGAQYVVDGHHRLAAARMANVDAVGIRDVTDQLNDGGFLGYKDMDDVVESASTFLGNRLNRRKL